MAVAFKRTSCKSDARIGRLLTCAVTPLSAASVARRKPSSAASSCASLLKPCDSAHLSAHSPYRRCSRTPLSPALMLPTRC